MADPFKPDVFDHVEYHLQQSTRVDAPKPSPKRSPFDTEEAYEVDARESYDNRKLYDPERAHEVDARESYIARAEQPEDPDIEFQPSIPVLGPGVAPLSGIVKLTSGYGKRERPKDGASKHHRAIDFGAPAGTPALSMRSGRVVFAGRDRGHGNRVIVQFYDGTTVAYSHLQNIDVKDGERVVMGQRVGSVGSTGVSTGPHLHIEASLPGRDVLKFDERSNPLKILPELSYVVDGLNNFGEPVEQGASAAEIELLRRKYQEITKRLPPVPLIADQSLYASIEEAYQDYASASGLSGKEIADSVMLRSGMTSQEAADVMAEAPDDDILSGQLQR